MYRVSKKSNCIFGDMGDYKQRERSILYTGRKVVKIILEAKLLSKDKEMKQCCGKQLLGNFKAS